MPPYEDELTRIVAELNRASPSGPGTVPENPASLDQLLIPAVRRSASDLLLIAGAPPMLRIAGSLTPAGPPLDDEEIRKLLPPVLRKLAEARQGLVLITGQTGCGKSSTLAALLELINTNRRDHVVTIEDPVEYVHT